MEKEINKWTTDEVAWVKQNLGNELFNTIVWSLQVQGQLNPEIIIRAVFIAGAILAKQKLEKK